MTEFQHLVNLTKKYFRLMSHDHLVCSTIGSSEFFGSTFTCLSPSWILQSPCPSKTAEYLPCVIIGARILRVYTCITNRSCKSTIYEDRWLLTVIEEAVPPESIRIQGRELAKLPEVENISSSFPFFHTKLHNINTYPDLCACSMRHRLANK